MAFHVRIVVAELRGCILHLRVSAGLSVRPPLQPRSRLHSPLSLSLFAAGPLRAAAAATGRVGAVRARPGTRTAHVKPSRRPTSQTEKYTGGTDDRRARPEQWRNKGDERRKCEATVAVLHPGDAGDTIWTISVTNNVKKDIANNSTSCSINQIISRLHTRAKSKLDCALRQASKAWSRSLELQTFTSTG